MQVTMAHELEQTSLKFIISVNTATSWLTKPDSDGFILS
jgi:hypothetical protein